MRHDDALRTRVEQARSVVVFLARHAHQRRDACVERSHRNGVGRLHRGGAVFQVDEQVVEPGSLHDTRDLDTAHAAHAVMPECPSPPLVAPHRPSLSLTAPHRPSAPPQKK
mgnify:CR=1 FL=1